MCPANEDVAVVVRDVGEEVLKVVALDRVAAVSGLEAEAEVAAAAEVVAPEE
jgi:hypothetical protein